MHFTSLVYNNYGCQLAKIIFYVPFYTLAQIKLVICGHFDMCRTIPIHQYIGAYLNKIVWIYFIVSFIWLRRFSFHKEFLTAAFIHYVDHTWHNGRKLCISFLQKTCIHIYPRYWKNPHESYFHNKTEVWHDWDGQATWNRCLCGRYKMSSMRTFWAISRNNN